MNSTAFEFLSYPYSTRLLALRLLDRLFGLLSYEQKLRVGRIRRAHYGHCLLQAAKQAKVLGYPAISALEFGVSGGRGLLAMEDHAEEVEKLTGVRVEVYGFDGGSGMPQPIDYRDLPYVWQHGFYQMDVDKLRSQLRRAKLVIGPVRETVRRFAAEFAPAPIGFISFDLDYYSSTSEALQLFEGEVSNFIPRVVCYFDDIVGDVDWAFSDYVGELLAIHEFNERHTDRKLARPAGLRHSQGRVPMAWHEQIYVFHQFHHPRYTTLINLAHQQQPIA